MTTIIKNELQAQQLQSELDNNVGILNEMYNKDSQITTTMLGLAILRFEPVIAMCAATELARLRAQDDQYLDKIVFTIWQVERTFKEGDAVLYKTFCDSPEKMLDYLVGLTQIPNNIMMSMDRITRGVVIMIAITASIAISRLMLRQYEQMEMEKTVGG